MIWYMTMGTCNPSSFGISPAPRTTPTATTPAVMNAITAQSTQATVRARKMYIFNMNPPVTPFPGTLNICAHKEENY